MSISDSNIDTSVEMSTNILDILLSSVRVVPFRALACFVGTALNASKNGSKTCENPYELMSSGAPKVATSIVSNMSEEAMFDSRHQPLLLPMSLNNNANCLNTIMASLHTIPSHIFHDNIEYESDTRYYEQIIFESKTIPTRQNWHDFFNGLIWSQFPCTKAYFNSCHIEQIARSGNVKKRTSQRDKLTHFDECGLVLFTSCSNIQTQLLEHDWEGLFVSGKDKWHTQIVPIIFGHALWEMLLNPFIGLTAKVTVIRVDNAQLTILTKTDKSREFYALCDDMLLSHIQENHLINAKRPWLPMPLLGIPQWSHIEQDASFYSNEQYFMAKRN